jgi:hypothetical protein
MFSVSLREIQLGMSVFLFALGFITFAVGLYILLSSTRSKDVRTIAVQTAKLAQKGLAEDVAGLVGNASALLAAMNSMVTTATGTGVFLIIISSLMMAGAFWLIFRIN